MEKNSRIILAKNIKIDKNNVTRLSNADLLSVLRDNSHLMYEGTDFEFIKNNKISLPCSYQTALSSNYLYFNNRNYYNKGFFAWITNVEYINDGCTEITYEIDTWSTWYDSLQFLRCFVNREMVTDDTIGEHTIQENLDVGDVIAEGQTIIDLSSEYYIIVNTNYVPSGTAKYWTNTGGGEAGPGVNLSGCKMYNKNIFSGELLFFETTNIINLQNFLFRVNIDGKIDSIQNIFICSKNIISVVTQGQFITKTCEVEMWNGLNPLPSLESTFYELPANFNENSIPFSIEQSIGKPLSFGDWFPHNNKIFVYPYNYIYITNGNGENNILKIENFDGNNLVFDILYSITIGGSCRLIPKNYQGKNRDIDNSISLGKLPTCQWSSDSYTNWLTQNAVNIDNEIIKTFVNAGGQLMSGDFVGANLTIANSIFEQNEKFSQARLLPNKTGGTNTGDVCFSASLTNFYIYRMHPKIEYLMQIDDFFDRFGYKVNALKIPNIATRTYWNYVEIGSNERSAITNPSSSYPVPQSDLDDINDKLRKGLTIWNNVSNIGNYSLDNSIN